MKDIEQLYLAAMLHDIGKFRMRRPKQSGQHQEHSYEFVTQDFSDFFDPCGDIFANAIRHHHPERYPGKKPHELEHLTEKQVILADRLSARERETEERAGEHYTRSPLVSILSKLSGSTGERRYALRELAIDEPDTILPSESVEVNQNVYDALWNAFIAAFERATAGQTYTAASYQTIVALLHKYTARIPSATSTGGSSERSVPDSSLYDHLRTTAAIAACIGRELSDEAEVDALLRKSKKSQEQNICMLIKGDISGIQNFLYQIVSDGAAKQLRGRSFYLQLLTEAIAHWVLQELELPITNLLLASGGHFYVLAPHKAATEQMDTLRQKISEKLWKYHNGDLSCLLADAPVSAADFEAEAFPKKWKDVSEALQRRKQQKWAELEPADMFQNVFEPHTHQTEDLDFVGLGDKVRDPKYLVTFVVPATDREDAADKPNWQDALRAFGLEVHLIAEKGDTPEKPGDAEQAVVYRLGNTDFLAETDRFRWDDLPVGYDFRMLPQVLPRSGEDRFADYDYLAEAAEGVHWLGALRMDVDDLGAVFSKKLENATPSRLATLSESMRLFFEGYVPELCRKYNKRSESDVLELIYAGGDDLFLVGGWSALPEIAQEIRGAFRQFVTGDHVTLSGGIAIEHRKFPLYQFAAQSGDAEKAAKNRDGKDAISFLRTPMTWAEFGEVRDWHERFIEASGAGLPRGFLTRLRQIYSQEELAGHRWAYRSLYYFHRLQERYKSQREFLKDLKNDLNSGNLKAFIHVITRWAALQTRKMED